MDQNLRPGRIQPKLRVAVTRLHTMARRALHMSGLRGGENARLPLFFHQRPTLDEPVEADDLRLEAVELLRQVGVTHLHLHVRHLQWDEALLDLLLDLLDAALQAATLPINPVTEASLHLLMLIQHETNTRIHQVTELGAAGIVEWVGIHRTN
jgi:hypothetical protein